MFRKVLLTGAALCGVLAVSDPASAGTTLLNLSLIDAPQPGTPPISPFYGSINPFYGSINPFYGSINPFYGSISPFWGDISPFWGSINPFYGSINPFYGNLDAFWGANSPFTTNNALWANVGNYWQAAGPQWGSINATWNQLQASNATNYSALQTQLNAFLAQAATFWGPAVQKATGQNFADGFDSAMLARYGIDTNDPNSLANATAQQRSAFFLNWYDGLMSFTGVDHVDWWMPAVHWSPLLTQTVGSTPSVVGLLDSTFTAANADVASVTFVGGYNYYVNDHGAMVASLIAAQEDGTGVMGIASNAQIHLYNPFDSTGTASWNDVATGIAALYNSGAHVVNASLGVPGTTVSNEWVNILSGPLLSPRAHDLVIVKAAGNEGVSQTQNVPWLLGLEPPNNLIIVGSVGPNNTISSFSNTPGKACFTILGICLPGNQLMYHYLVAPGELMLVSDNHGGVVRMTGTSFAAPLVTATVALLQERWPWLQQHAEETAQIIFQSADDLGAPGVDPVYGWGELDVQAAMSPLNFNNLEVFAPYNYNGSPAFTPLLPNSSARSLKASLLNPGQLALWQKQSAFLVAFEPIGGTYRDFEIPLSSLLVGKSQKVNGYSNPFQSYLYQKLIDWANSASLASFAQRSAALGDGAWSLAMTETPATAEETSRGEAPYHSEFVASNAQSGVALKIGEGNGVHALMGEGGNFTLGSDFDPSTGGVNPVLGLASGGVYGSSTVTVWQKLRLSIGVSEKADSHTLVDPTFGPYKEFPLATNRATASVATADYALGKDASLAASYTHLDEADAMLGAQGGGALDFTGGSATDAATFGANTAFGAGWSLSLTGTVAKTAAPSLVQNSLLTLSKDLQSTAYELAATKSGLLDDSDQMRLSFAQPLHVESGTLTYQSLQVIDRDTGALGPLSQTWNISGNREYRMEALYSRPAFGGSFDAFGLVDLNSPLTQGRTVSASFGTQYRITF